jgi:hypothetical protein
MAEPIDGPFAVALRDGRQRYNALFAQARRTDPSLTPDSLSAFLRQHAAAVVNAAANAAPKRLQIVADAIFDLSIELLSCDLPSRCPAIVEGWSTLLAGLPRHMAADPPLFAGSITNALYKFSLVPG